MTTETSIKRKISDLDTEMQESLKNMIESPDEKDILLALSIMETFDFSDQETCDVTSKLNRILLDKCEKGWEDYIRLKNTAREMQTGDKGAYDEYK
jgi:hypothetical protein